MKIAKHACPGTNHGFTVVEAMVAFVILAAGLLALLSFHGTAQRNNADAKIQAEAVALAEDKLQELQSFLTESDPRLSLGLDSDSPSGQLVDYTRSWEISEDISANVLFADVWVAWDDREGIAQEVALSAAINLREPFEYAERFIEVATKTFQAGSPGGTWGEVPGTGGGDGVGDNDNGNGEDGTNPDPSEPQTTYTRIIEGESGRNLSGVQLENAPEIIEAAADSTLLSTSANCTRPTNRSFRCTVTYFNASIGWSGTITLTANGNQTIQGDAPHTTSCANTVNLTFNGVTQNTSVNLSSC